MAFFKEVFMKKIKQILKYMEKYRGIYFLGLLCVVASQILVVSTPLILQTTIDNILGDNEITNGLIQTIVTKLGGVDHLRANLWIVGLVLVAGTTARGIFFFLRKYLTGMGSEEVVRNLRDHLYDHIQKLPYEYHVKSETGELIQRSTSDVEIIRKFLSLQLIEFLGAFFLVITVLFTMYQMNSQLASISLVILPITVIFSLFFLNVVKREFEVAEEKDGALTTMLQENLTGIRVVKAFNRQEYEMKKFDVINGEYRKANYQISKSMAKFWGISDFLSMTQVGVIVVYGSYLTYLGQISLGEFTAFTTFINLLVWPVRMMGRNLAEMSKAIVSLDRINIILAEEIEDLNEFNFKPEISGDITFENVNFSYEDDHKILTDISFSVKKGETVAIIGPTGAGKSSLVQLLSRLYEYDSGSIKFDGNELNQIDKSWARQNVGLILQEPFLYAKNIRENIRLVNPKTKDDIVVRAAKVASVHNDIESFDKGYDTIVGEKGSSLSGGQKQRVAIARTIINENPIVIFDDSLSAVDTETDISIRTALKNRKNKSTTIIISHRISTASEADLILVLDKGKIVQRGKHDELIKQDGIYKKFYDIQNNLDADEVI